MEGLGAIRRSAPKAPEPLFVRQAKRELLAKRMLGDSREFTQCGVDVLGPHADALLLVEFQHAGIDRDRELLLVGGADHAVALDAAAEELHRADGPVVLAVARVVIWSAAHFALNDDVELLANLEFAG